MNKNTKLILGVAFFLVALFLLKFEFNSLFDAQSHLVPGGNSPTAANVTAGSLQPAIAAPFVSEVLPATTANSAIVPVNAPNVTAKSAKGLRFATAPANGSKLVIDRVKRGPGKYVITDPNALETKPPLAIYNLPLAGIAKGEGLENAQPAGFQYLVEDAGELVLTATVHVDDSGVARMGSVGANSNAMGGASIAHALNQLANLEQVRAGSYEARLLKAPPGGIHLMAIWLKADPEGADLIYPLLPINPNLRPSAGLQAEKLYTVDEFLNLYRPYLQKQFQNAAQQGGGSAQ